MKYIPKIMASFCSLPSCRLIFLFFIFCFSMALAKSCTKLDTCSCKMNNDTGIISLQEIDNKDGKPSITDIPDVTTPRYTFDWNPCTPIKSSDPCNGNNVCQHTPDLFPAGLPDTTFTINTDGNVVITYKKITYGGYTRHLEVTLKCDKTKPKGSFGDGITETTGTDESTYTGTFASKCACPGACSYTPPTEPSGLSIGSILLIIFFPLLFFYFVLGIVVNKYARHKEGTDVIPNFSFWTDLPFLVKDGCVFSCVKMKSCYSSLREKSNRNSYTAI